MSDEARRPFGGFSLISKMVGTALLHRATHEEIKSDKNANYQAILVVLLAGLAIGFGVGPGYGIPLGSVIYWFSWWAVWVFLLYLALPLFSTKGTAVPDWSQIARSTGFAQSPAIFLALLSFIGWLGPSVSITFFAVVVVWWFAAMLVAVRHTLALTSMTRAAVIAGTFLIPQFIIETGLF